jgi:hypothetical protein
MEPNGHAEPGKLSKQERMVVSNGSAVQGFGSSQVLGTSNLARAMHLHPAMKNAYETGVRHAILRRLTTHVPFPTHSDDVKKIMGAMNEVIRQMMEDEEQVVSKTKLGFPGCNALSVLFVIIGILENMDIPTEYHTDVINILGMTRSNNSWLIKNGLAAKEMDWKTLLENEGRAAEQLYLQNKEHFDSLKIKPRRVGWAIERFANLVAPWYAFAEAHLPDSSPWREALKLEECLKVIRTILGTYQGKLSKNFRDYLLSRTNMREAIVPLLRLRTSSPEIMARAYAPSEKKELNGMMKMSPYADALKYISMNTGQEDNSEKEGDYHGISEPASIHHKAGRALDKFSRMNKLYNEISWLGDDTSRQDAEYKSIVQRAFSFIAETSNMKKKKREMEIGDEPEEYVMTGSGSEDSAEGSWHVTTTIPPKQKEAFVITTFMGVCFLVADRSNGMQYYISEIEIFNKLVPLFMNKQDMQISFFDSAHYLTSHALGDRFFVVNDSNLFFASKTCAQRIWEAIVFEGDKKKATKKTLKEFDNNLSKLLLEELQPAPVPDSHDYVKLYSRLFGLSTLQMSIRTICKTIDPQKMTNANSDHRMHTAFEKCFTVTSTLARSLTRSASKFSTLHPRIAMTVPKMGKRLRAWMSRDEKDAFDRGTKMMRKMNRHHLPVSW